MKDDTSFKGIRYHRPQKKSWTNLLRSEVPTHRQTWSTFLRPIPTSASHLASYSHNAYGSSETQHLKTCAIMGREGSSQLLRCNQSANLMVQPLYSTLSTNLRSFVPILNVVTLGSESASVLCNGLAVPGDAGIPAKLVLEVKGGPEGGSADTRA